jgi:hypothetical protein
MPTVEQIKASVRERDGHCCVDCGMTTAEHMTRYGRRLDVHRKQPGSRYTVDGCETVCKRCHRHKPVSRRRVPTGKPFMFRVPPAMREALESLTERNASTLTSEIVTAIRTSLTESGLWPAPKQ